MIDITDVRLEKHPRSGLLLYLQTKEGPVGFKLSISKARLLMKLLFIHVSPGWGGTREGAGRKDGIGED